MNINRELTKNQAKAVYHYKGPLLVLAGPGSGKTRVITYRVAYLIRNHSIAPESILAVTFTNKAAEEMHNRLHDDSLLGETIGMEVWIHTFHKACVCILREYGEKIGLDPRFTVFSQEDQDAILLESIRDIGSTVSQRDVWLVRDFISDAKVRLKDPLESDENDSRMERLRARNEMEGNSLDVELDDLLEITQRYQQYLKDHSALDFDDLVSKTVRLLSSDNKVREQLRKKFQFIMVDEYQDINLAQYELLNQLCNPERNIMVVADDDQSIYSWRGSDPSFIDRFKEEYKPKTIQLIDHFRSTKNILRASQSLIEKNPRLKKGSLITENARGDVIYHYKLNDESQELEFVTWLIRRLIRKKHYSPGQIAIFYRTHKLADKLEQHLKDRKLEIKRIRRENFFDDPAVKSILGYLRTICWHFEPDLEMAINFPDMILDELTKLQLENTARKEGIGFIDVLRNIDTYEDVGPLTKRRVKEFVSLIDGLVADLKDEPANKVVRRLFEVLEAERSPYHSKDIEAITNPESLGNLWLAVNALYGAIQQGQTVSVVASYGIDSYCTAGIIIYVLEGYFNMRDRMEYHFMTQDKDASGIWTQEGSRDDNIYIVIGSADNIPISVTQRTIFISSERTDAEKKLYPCIADLSAGEGGVLSTTALKLCQRLLTQYEAGNMNGLVVYDLETIGNNPKTAQIIEVAAKKIGLRRTSNEQSTFSQLVKPKNAIPPSSTKIHGITNQDVKDKPGIEQVLPEFLRFIGNNILAGHNIVMFDNKVISREMSTYMGRAELTNPSYDTLGVARKLFPRENYKLDALADRFNIEYDSSSLHRALYDVELTEKILRELRKREIANGEQKSLKEVLPLVAIGILEKNAQLEKENNAYLNATLRYLNYNQGRSGTIELLPISHLEPVESEEAERLLDELKKRESPRSIDDEDWNATMAKFQNSVVSFEQSGSDRSLIGFLNHTALLTGIDVSEGGEDKITMMTAHSAKGTEFPVVIMIGMEQGNFPIMRKDQTEQELEEERRLCYVGITRAKKQLYMVSVRFRDDRMEREMTPSQFIWEIQPDLIKTVYASQVEKGLRKKLGQKILASKQ